MAGPVKGGSFDQNVTRSTPMLRLPPFQEINNVFRPDSGGGFEFAFFLADDEFAVGIEDGEAGDPLFEGNFIFLSEVQVLVIIPYIYMNHVVVLVEERRHLLRMERSVQNVAVVAPISAEYQNDSPMVL